MAIYKTTIPSNNVQYNIANSHEIFTLGETSTLTSSTNGIYEGAEYHENTIRVLGNIDAGDTLSRAGVYSAGSETTVIIGASATVQAAYGLDINGDKAEVINNGDINGISFGISMGTGSATGSQSLVNNGSASASLGYAVNLNNANVLKFVNNGDLTGSNGIAGHAKHLFITLGKESVINTTQTSIDISSTAGDEARIVNLGSITAGTNWAFFGRGGDETFINRGTMSGPVTMGLGDDVFDNRGGSVDDRVGGDDGNDTFYITQSNFDAYEQTGDGHDRVFSTASYNLGRFGSELEELRLLGGKDINATGNQYKNTLVGNSGDNLLNGMTANDSLRGNGGADVFIFSTGTGKDTIVDFVTGTDRIDLGDLNAITGFSDLKSNHLSTVGGDAHITAGSDVIIIKGVTAGELDAADFLF